MASLCFGLWQWIEQHPASTHTSTQDKRKADMYCTTQKGAVDVHEHRLASCNRVVLCILTQEQAAQHKKDDDEHTSNHCHCNDHFKWQHSYRGEAVGYKYTHCQIINTNYSSLDMYMRYTPGCLVNRMGLLGWLAPIAFTATIVTLYCTLLLIFPWGDVSKLVWVPRGGKVTISGGSSSALEFDYRNSQGFITHYYTQTTHKHSACKHGRANTVQM